MASKIVSVAACASLGAAINLDTRGNANFLGAHAEIDQRDGFDSQVEIQADLRDLLQGMATDLISIKPVEGMASVRDGMTAVSGKMDFKTALKAIDHRSLPTEVQSLVKTASASGGSTIGEFSEESLAKARIALNDLVEKAWVELDDKIIECKEYQEMNRATFDQVVTDISRLVEQITDLGRVETESLDGISRSEMEIKGVEDELGKETQIYNLNYAKNTEELTRRQNDLDVFQFILVFTKCKTQHPLSRSQKPMSTRHVSAPSREVAMPCASVTMAHKPTSIKSCQNHRSVPSLRFSLRLRDTSCQISSRSVRNLRR